MSFFHYCKNPDFANFCTVVIFFGPVEQDNEELVETKKYAILNNRKALKLRALRPFKDGDQERIPGEEWVLRGPLSYVETVETEIVEVIEAIIIKPNHALKLRALRDTIDINGNERLTSQNQK